VLALSHDEQREPHLRPRSSGARLRLPAARAAKSGNRRCAVHAPRPHRSLAGVPSQDFLERRLQTQVFKLGLAKSIHHARVLIRHRHIRVGKQIVNIPSFMVRTDSQKHIDFAITSPTRRSTSTSPSPRRLAEAHRLRHHLADSQKHIDFAITSPYGGGRPGRNKRKAIAAKGGGGGGGDDEDME